MDGDKEPSATTMTENLLTIGQQQLKKGNLRKAKAAFEYAYKKAKACGSCTHQNISLINLSSIYITAKKPSCSVKCLQMALALNSVDTDVGDLHYALAIAYEMMDHISDASKEYDLALAAYRDNGATYHMISNVAAKLGVFHMKHGKYKKAIGCFNISTQILSDKELIAQLVTVLCLKAKCLVTSDKTVPDAIEVCEECVKLCKLVQQDIFVGKYHSIMTTIIV